MFCPVDPHISADPKPLSQNIVYPTVSDPDPQRFYLVGNEWKEYRPVDFFWEREKDTVSLF